MCIAFGTLFLRNIHKNGYPVFPCFSINTSSSLPNEPAVSFNANNKVLVNIIVEIPIHKFYPPNLNIRYADWSGLKNPNAKDNRSNVKFIIKSYLLLDSVQN